MLHEKYLLSSSGEREGVEDEGFTLPWAAANCFAPQLLVEMRRRSAWSGARNGHGDVQSGTQDTCGYGQEALFPALTTASFVLTRCWRDLGDREEGEEVFKSQGIKGKVVL